MASTVWRSPAGRLLASAPWPDEERIPLDLMIDTIGRVVAAVDLPVGTDLECGYGVANTVRRQSGVGRRREPRGLGRSRLTAVSGGPRMAGANGATVVDAGEESQGAATAQQLSPGKRDADEASGHRHHGKRRGGLPGCGQASGE